MSIWDIEGFEDSPALERHRVSCRPVRPSGKAELVDDLGREFEEKFSVVSLNLKVLQLSNCIRQLQFRLDEVASTSPFRVVLHTLDTLPFRLKAPLEITVRSEDDEFLAEHFDTGLSMIGETEQLAIRNLKDLIADTYEQLESVGEENLGNLLKRQFATLKFFLEPCSLDEDAKTD